MSYQSNGIVSRGMGTAAVHSNTPPPKLMYLGFTIRSRYVTSFQIVSDGNSLVSILAMFSLEGMY